MATTAIDVAPVLTPQSLGVLADTFERSGVPEKALSLRKLQPFVHGMVEKYFLPLSASAGRNRFAGRVGKYAQGFEPYRIYLNFRLLTILGNRWFPDRYAQFLNDLLESRLKTARDMDMCPELIFTAVHDYLQILGAFVNPTAAPGPQVNEATLQQITDIVEWLHASTRFDYGLTAVFLVLEKSIPEPAPVDKSGLLLAFKKALLELGRATTKVVVDEKIRGALQDLKTRLIEIPLVEEESRVVRSTILESKQKRSVLGPSLRQTEMSWLTRNKNLSDQYGGQWIVLEKDELVANDENYSKAREAATHRGIKRPFIIFVPVKGTGEFMGICVPASILTMSSIIGN
jgi:hypothetical protein